MRMRLVTGFLAVAAVVAHGTMPAAQSDSLEQQFHKLELRWMDALHDKDAAVLEDTLAPGFTIIGAGSSVADATTTRQQWLDVGLKRPFPKHAVKIVKVTRSGNTAVVQCILTADYPPMPWIPKGGTLQFLTTDTWVQSNGRWQVLARHSSLPPEPRQ